MSHLKNSLLGLRHLALFVNKFDETLAFYQKIIGMDIVWQPDADNVYLSSGIDNLALHRANRAISNKNSPLDHLGFILRDPDAVDAWHLDFLNKGVNILAAPKTHRDGARSFYCQDPDGNAVQFIYHPDLK